MPSYLTTSTALWKCLCLVVSIGGVVTLILAFYISHDYSFIGGGYVRKYDGVWIKVTRQLSVFSAHYDNRGERDNFKARVQIMAFVKDSYHRDMYCYFDYSNATLCLKQTAALRVFRTFENSPITDRQYYNPVMYSCVLPTAQIPNAVGISADKHCGFTGGSNRRKLLVVNYEKGSPMKEFGVCVHSPLFNMSDHEFVAAFVEMNRILGAEWFTFYVHSASRLVLKLLQTYQEDGLIEVVRNWGEGMPNARYYGQDLSVQDCLYRNMYKVKYLVYTDVDELIFPTKHPNWHEMMKALDLDGEISTFYFLHVALFTNAKSRRHIKKVRQIYGRCDNGSVQRLLQTPRVLSFTLRSKRMNKSKAKMVLKPLTIRALRIHQVLEFVDKPHNRSTFVDGGVAFLLHYRLFGLDKFRKRTLYFNKLQSFVPQLFFNLKNRLCHLT